MRWIVLAVVAASLAGAAALAQSMDHGAPPMHGNMPMHGAMPMHMHGAPGATGSLPTQPGQSVFGAVQEIVGVLEADPAIDWSKVNLDALRVHLVDMNEVALHTDAAVERTNGGIRVAITGTGRTLVAIQRMLPEHAREMNGKKAPCAGRIGVTLSSEADRASGGISAPRTMPALRPASTSRA